MGSHLKLIDVGSVPDPKTASARVLKELGSEDGHTIAVPHREEEDEESHPDERWLVSYADMMTLLFGLFVMLYSMAGQFEVVKRSAARRFGSAPAAGAEAAPPLDAEALSRKLAEAQTELDRLRSELKNTAQENTQLKASVAELDRRIAALSAQLSSVRPVAALSSVTIVMKWSTQAHDVDLVIKDPEGHVFDFKHRQYAGSPGKFVLDSRHGPGAELWQADRILPGTYEARATFYNPYGNPDPAKVSFTFLTVKGSTELPEKALSFERNPEWVVRFTAKADGTIQLAP